MLIQRHCGDLCGPHPWCTDCQAGVCEHTLDLWARCDDVRAAIASLPGGPDERPAVCLSEVGVVYEPTCVGGVAAYLVSAWAAQLSPWSKWSRLVWSGCS